MKYKIIIKLKDYFESPEIVIEAINWEDLGNIVMGSIEIIDTQEDSDISTEE